MSTTSQKRAYPAPAFFRKKINPLESMGFVMVAQGDPENDPDILKSRLIQAEAVVARFKVALNRAIDEEGGKWSKNGGRNSELSEYCTDALRDLKNDLEIIELAERKPTEGSR